MGIEIFEFPDNYAPENNLDHQRHGTFHFCVEDPFGIVFEVYSHRYELTYSVGAYSKPVRTDVVVGPRIEVRSAPRGPEARPAVYRGPRFGKNRNRSGAPASTVSSDREDHRDQHRPRRTP